MVRGPDTQARGACGRAGDTVGWQARGRGVGVRGRGGGVREDTHEAQDLVIFLVANDQAHLVRAEDADVTAVISSRAIDESRGAEGVVLDAELIRVADLEFGCRGNQMTMSLFCCCHDKKLLPSAVHARG